MMKSEILNIKNICTGYKNGIHKKIVSESLSASIFEGRLVGLLGPNGCGKSTLLRSIAGLQPILNGDIRISDKNIEILREKEKSQLLSLVLTDKITSTYLRVKDIVAIGRHPYTGVMGVLQQEDKDIIDKSIIQCNLTNYVDRIYNDLSDGEQQRVMLARALTQNTPLMILDEPTAHLDIPNRIEMMRILRDLAVSTSKAILLSTHELDLALQWCDDIWIMNEKGEMYVGTPEDLVLNGIISEIFNNESFFFDMASGLFKMKRQPQFKINVLGDDIIRTWTIRALEREGYEISEINNDTEFTIYISECKEWIIRGNNKETKHKTIKSVLEELVNNKPK